MYRKTFSDFKKTLDNDIRTIIHKGKNVACYKFPWFQTILTFAEQGKTHIKKECFKNICNWSWNDHNAWCHFQNVSNSSK